MWIMWKIYMQNYIYVYKEQKFYFLSNWIELNTNLSKNKKRSFLLLYTISSLKSSLKIENHKYVNIV